MNAYRVTILQEYVPHYRAEFFRALIELAQPKGIEIIVGAGAASAAQAGRRDGADAGFVRPIPQRQFRMFRRRLTVRCSHSVVKGSDLLVLEQARRNLDIYRLFLPFRPARASVALWGHGDDYAGSKSRFESWLRRAVTLRADWFFGYTTAGVETVVGYGFDEGHTTIVQNSTDSTGLATLLRDIRDEELAAFMHSHHLTNQTALFMGALVSTKKIKFLLEASDVLHSRLPGFCLLIAGEGPLRKEVFQYARTRPWISVVGPAFNREKALALRAAKILLMPGAIGLVAIDSFVAGTPIITISSSAHGPEFGYLTAGKDSIILSNDDIGAYVSAAEGLLTRDEELARFAEACLQEAQKYSVEQMALNFLAGIQAALLLRERHA